MKTKFYLDRRTELKALSSGVEREYPVKIAINHKGSSAYLPTGVSVAERYWISKPGVGMVVNYPKASRLNIVLSEKKLAVDKIIETLRERGELHGASASEIKTRVQRELETEGGINGRETPALVCFERLIKAKAGKVKPRTIETYKWTMGKLQQYEGFTPDTTFTDITAGWLSGFDSFLALTSPSANARAVYLRALRTAFNFAIDEALTTAPYPFKKFKIRTAPTADRSMTREDLRRLYNAPCEGAAQKYRDFFFLSFLLCGMNLEDILAIRPKDVKGGRIEIRRIKTGQPLSIKIEPEAYNIIYKYRDITGERLVSIGKCSNYVNFLHRLNDSLKRIGMNYNPSTKKWEGEALFPGISYYWARYSWPTIAAELDIPEKTAGFGMGHNTAKTVTSIYTRVDMRKKLDKANRQIIDYVGIGEKLQFQK